MDKRCVGKEDGACRPECQGLGGIIRMRLDIVNHVRIDSGHGVMAKDVADGLVRIHRRIGDAKTGFRSHRKTPSVEG